jgi:hypothetical protein
MIADSFPSPRTAAAVRAPGGWLLPVRVLLFGLSVPFLVRRGPERLARLLEPTPPPPPAADPAAAAALARRIDRWLRAGWPLVRRGCLTRGITQYRFLRRAGFDVSLRFGLGEVNGKFEGHCWLVRDGQPFLEKRDPRPVYTEMWRVEGKG